MFRSSVRDPQSAERVDHISHDHGPIGSDVLMRISKYLGQRLPRRNDLPGRHPDGPMTNVPGTDVGIKTPGTQPVKGLFSPTAVRSCFRRRRVSKRPHPVGSHICRDSDARPVVADIPRTSAIRGRGGRADCFSTTDDHPGPPSTRKFAAEGEPRDGCDRWGAESLGNVQRRIPRLRLGVSRRTQEPPLDSISLHWSR